MPKFVKLINAGYKTMDNLKDIFKKIRYSNNNGQSKTAFELLKRISNNDLNLKKDMIFNLEMRHTLFGLSKFDEALGYFQKVLAYHKNNIYAQKDKMKILYTLNKEIDLRFVRKIFRSDKNDGAIRDIFADILIKNTTFGYLL